MKTLPNFARWGGYLFLIIWMASSVSALNYQLLDYFELYDASVGFHENVTFNFKPNFTVASGDTVLVTMGWERVGNPAQDRNCQIYKMSTTLGVPDPAQPISNLFAVPSAAATGIYNFTATLTSEMTAFSNYTITCERRGAPGDRFQPYWMSTGGNVDSVCVYSSSGATFDTSCGAADLYFYTYGEYSVTPEITLLKPDNNNVTNIDVNLTFTVANANTDNCSLYDNRSGTWAYSGRNITGTVAGNHDFGKTGLGSVEGKWLWGVVCYDSAGSYWSTTNRTLIVDLSFPTITLNPSNEWKTTNLSKNNPYDDDFQINVTFIDDRDLYAATVEITKGGTKYFNWTSIITGNVSYTFSNFTNISTWQEGTYNIRIRVSDSHTAKMIPDYAVSKSNGKLSFDTPEGNSFSIETNEDATVDAVKHVDRYSTEFEFSDGLTKDRVFNVKSKEKIDYLPGSAYKAHFVIYKDGVGNWIDFEGVAGTPVVEKVSDKHYKVTFFNLNSKVRFNSVGSLNTYEVFYTWYRGNYTLLAPNGYVLESSTLYLNVSKVASITDVNASLIYNSVDVSPGTKSQATTLVQFSDSVTNPATAINYSYYWTIKAQQSDGESWTFNTTTKVHMVLTWTLDQCSASSTKSIVFANYLEPYINFPQNVSYEVSAKYWLTSPLLYKNYSAEAINFQNLTLCASNNMYADIYVQYKATDGFTHRWLLYNQSLSTTTLVTQKIYNYNYTSGVSTLRITARDIDSFSYFKDAVVTLQHYYPSLNQWVSVQMGKTDDYGFVFFNVLEKSTDYRLMFRDTNNNLLKITETLTFSCDSGVCTILALLEPHTALDGANNVSVSYSYNNNTKILTVNWRSGLDVALSSVVSKETGKGTTQICNYYTSSTMTGSTTCNLSGYNGVVRLAVNSTYSGAQALSFTVFIDIGNSKLNSYVDQAEGAVYAFFIMCVVVGFGVWSPVAMVISAMFGMVTIYFLGLVSAMSMTMLTIAIIMAIIISLKLRS